ncbi:N-acetylgalactosamine-specific PTS system, EIID component [Proteus mirabilis]|uniref:N-acetylgalactosamine-specific PTS system, EIID component n=1 Tax=Proteus mirabilis TaxID=584 RepID=A0A379GEI3_PROMI|nr:N-acetylgalactosamine-specific PTS system, EIID component [Proteus mirabilis]
MEENKEKPSTVNVMKVAGMGADWGALAMLSTI